jgi:hypothetical protein
MIFPISLPPCGIHVNGKRLTKIRDCKREALAIPNFRLFSPFPEGRGDGCDGNYRISSLELKKPGGNLRAFDQPNLYCTVTDASFRRNQLFHSRFSHTTRIGEALKMEEYVPLNTPISRITTK